MILLSVAILFFCCIPAFYLGLSLSLYSSCTQLDQLKTFLKASQACLTRWVTFSGSRGTSPTCQGQSSGGLKIPFSGRPPHLPAVEDPPIWRHQSFPGETRGGGDDNFNCPLFLFQLPFRSFLIAFSFFFKYLFFLFQFSPNSSHKEARWNWNQEHLLCWWDGLFHSWVKVKTLVKRLLIWQIGASEVDKRPKLWQWWWRSWLQNFWWWLWRKFECKHTNDCRAASLWTFSLVLVRTLVSYSN